MAATMKIHGDSNSGNCLKVKFVCEHLAIPYSWIEVDTRNRQTRTTEFLKLNSAGQVPTVEFDDGRTLSESNAIIKYLFFFKQKTAYEVEAFVKAWDGKVPIALVPTAYPQMTVARVRELKKIG